MIARTFLLASLFALAAGLPPVAASLGERCTVSVWSVTAGVTCTGTFEESASLSWCPNEDWIRCNNFPLFTCTVQTDRPVMYCPL